MPLTHAGLSSYIYLSDFPLTLLLHFWMIDQQKQNPAQHVERRVRSADKQIHDGLEQVLLCNTEVTGTFWHECAWVHKDMIKRSMCGRTMADKTQTVLLSIPFMSLKSFNSPWMYRSTRSRMLSGSYVSLCLTISPSMKSLSGWILLVKYSTESCKISQTFFTGPHSCPFESTILLLKVFDICFVHPFFAHTAPHTLRLT